MKEFTYLKEVGVNLALGASTRDLKCPYCGASDKGVQLSRVSEGLLFHCYHASCIGGTKFVPSIPYTDSIKPSKNKSTSNYKRTFRTLNAAEKRWLIQKFNLTATELAVNQIQYNPTYKTYIYPIMDYRGYETGFIDRSYSGRTPKSLTYWDNVDLPKIHFPYCTIKDGPIVIVEDVISAIRCARYYRSVALLGMQTSINMNIINVLHQLTDHIIEVLDADTWIPVNGLPVSVQHRNKYGIYFNRWDLIKVDKDPKDMSNTELDAYLLLT